MLPLGLTCSVPSFASILPAALYITLLSFLLYSIIMPDQLVVNQEVFDDGVCGTSANPSSSLPCINGDMTSPSNPRSSTTYPNHGLAVPHPTMSSLNHGGQPASLSAPRTSDVPSSSTRYACCDSTQEQCLTQSVSGFEPLSYCGSWRDPSTLHNYSYQHDPVHYPVVYPEIPTSDFRLYNEPSHQWQNLPQSGPLNGPLPPMTPPPLTAEALQMRFSSQARASHGGITCYPLDQPPIVNQPYSTPLRNYSYPLLLSCRWLYDNAPCIFTGTLDELKAHCRTSHFAGPPDGQIECRWEACTYHRRDDRTVHVMRRDCMWRHTCEIHLGMKRGI
ncbi:hypothetical protein F4604DRAFT_1720395 [Suillus subluteus]|nr:hypothetical protein F4604DRAFT_1720395 [Suillus subluteus]